MAIREPQIGDILQHFSGGIQWLNSWPIKSDQDLGMAIDICNANPKHRRIIAPPPPPVVVWPKEEPDGNPPQG
jgi:hypothetical protein